MSEITLTQTCGACPEQYDAYKDGKVVGYLRLRHGFFYAECPWSGGEQVYYANTKGDGIFDPDEREMELKAAIAAIEKWLETHDASAN